jgi:HEAT repeat protein
MIDRRSGRSRPAACFRPLILVLALIAAAPGASRAGSIIEDDNRGLDPVLKLLESADWRKRLQGVMKLSRGGPVARQALPQLLAATRDQNPQVAGAAMVAVIKVAPDDPRAMPAVRRALKHEQPAIRAKGAKALGMIGKAAAEAATDLAARLRDDSDLEVRRAAAVALGSVGAADAATATALVSALRETRSPDSWKVREAAAISLGTMASQARSAVPALVTAAGDESENVRAAALNTLKKLSPASLSGLEKLLAHSDGKVRIGAAKRLAGLLPDSKPALRRALISSHQDVSRAAASALGLKGAELEKAIAAAREGYFEDEAGELPAPPADDDAVAALLNAEKECKSWLTMARNYAANGMTGKAREYLDRIVDTYPDSEWAAEARKMLKGLAGGGGGAEKPDAGKEDEGGRKSDAG